MAVVASGVVVPLPEESVAGSHHTWQNANILGLAAAVLTLLPRLESVLVAIATAVDELLAHAVAALVVPLQQRLPARPTLLRQEAKFCSEIFFDGDDVNGGGRPAAPLAFRLALEVVVVAIVTFVEEGAAELVLAVKVPTLN